jgi:two-component system response regulator NreC
LNTLNVILAEDHAVVRDGIKLLLENDKSIQVIGVATNGAEVMELIDGPTKTDVLLTDIQMPGTDGITLIDNVKSVDPDIKVIVLSMHNNMTYVTEAFAKGASGYLLKECNPDELFFAIKNVTLGNHYLSMNMSSQLLGSYALAKSVRDDESASSPEFSEREMEVLQLISEGLTNNEMSERLFLSKRTVEGHRQSLLDKTGCRNTAVLIKYAVRHNLIK